MKPNMSMARRNSGMTLLELVISCSILLILSAAGLPIVQHTIVSQKEAELRHDLREMRDAIDRYKDLADSGKIRVEAGSEGYPPDLGTLVKGVNIGAGADKKIRFLRRIPKDPLTGRPNGDFAPSRTTPTPPPGAATTSSTSTPNPKPPPSTAPATPTGNASESPPLPAGRPALVSRSKNSN